MHGAHLAMGATVALISLYYFGDPKKKYKTNKNVPYSGRLKVTTIELLTLFTVVKFSTVQSSIRLKRVKDMLSIISEKIPFTDDLPPKTKSLLRKGEYVHAH